MKEKIVLDFSKRKKKGGMVIMGKKENKTNALRLLEQAGIGYDLHEFNVDEKILDHQINNNRENVYKTLVTQTNTKEYVVFVVQVDQTLDLKKAAKAVGAKKIEMVAQKNLLGLTGYVHGGCSPVGMKKSFPTFIGRSCLKYDRILCSAGRVGLLMEVDRESLIHYVRAKVVDVEMRQ